MKRVSCACLLALTILMPAQMAWAQLANSCWPKFRGDAANTGLGLCVGTGSDLTWTFAAGGAIRSAPAVGVDGTTYVACNDGCLYAVTGSGTLAWSYYCKCQGGASPTIGSDGTVYIGSSDNLLYAIRPSGTLKWKKSLAARLDSSVAVGSDGTIYFGVTNGTFYAAKPDSVNRWTYAAGGAIYSSPAIGPDGTVYFGCSDGGVYAMNTTGTRKWKFAPVGAGQFVAAPAVGSEGVIYIGSRGGYFYAVNAGGTLKWRSNAYGEVWSSAAIGPGGTSIYCGSRDGKLHALSSVNGAELWTYATGHYVDSSPAVGADGGVYVGSLDGSLYALNPSGTLRWTYNTGAAIYSSPAIGPAGAMLLGADNGTLYCFGGQDTPPPAPVVADDGEFTPSATTLHATWSDVQYPSGISSYEYSIGTAAGSTDVRNWTNVGLVYEVTAAGLTLSNGVTYFVNVRALDPLYRPGSIGSSDGITVDTTAPSQATVTDGGEFTANSSELHVLLAAEDAESGIALYECAVGTSPGATDVADWVSVGPGPNVTITELTLTNGDTHYVSARATNGAGITGPVGVSDGITVDTTPPVDLVVLDDGAYTADSTSLRGRWSASDPESGIARYRYCIGTAPGANDVADWLDVGSATEHTRTELTLATGTAYYITAVATNSAGADSASASSDGIVLDLTPPSTPVVTDTGQYWGYKTSIYASWSSDDPESGIAEYEMSVGTSPGATDVADWLSVGNHTSHTRTGLHLTDGISYYVNVRAKSGAGGWSDVGSSDGVLIDSTPPTTPVVVDDGDTTSVLDSLHATWSSTDPESGIAEYMYCVGTSPGATDMASWTSAALNTEVTISGITLDPVLRYYFSVKARSNAGAWSAVSASDGISCSSAAAVWWRFRNDCCNTGCGLFNATRVNDVGWIVATQGYVESSAAIAADGTSYVGSGDGKLYAITQNGTLRWTLNLGAAIDSSPAIADDGRILIGCSDGKLYCVSPMGTVQWSHATGGPVRSSPLIKNGVVYVGSSDRSIYAVNLEDGARVWSCATGGAVWSSPAIDEAGVVYASSEDGHLYAINPTGTRKWRFLTGSAADSSPALGSDGTVYFGSGDGSFYAVSPDGTKKWQFVIGMLADSSPAIGPDGNIYFGAGHDGGNGSLFALRPDGTQIWRVDLPGGGINSSPAIDPSGMIYVGACNHKMYAFNPDGTKCWEYATGSSVVGSPALGADSSVVFGSYDGHIYCLRDVTSKDLTPPTTPVVTVPSTALPEGDPLRASWIATDPESMVAEYTYAVGTTPGASDVTGWTSAGIETSIVREDLSLEVGSTCYVSAKARNPSQRWSETGVSQGVTIVARADWQTIGEVKRASDGANVVLRSKAVTAVFADCFFIEEADRSAGIRCVQAGVTLAPGDFVDVRGAVQTVNGEKLLAWVTHEPVGTGEPIPPVGVSGCALASPGLDPCSLLVRIWGKVTAIGEDRFVIDNGGKLAHPGGVRGIEVRSSEAVSGGDYVGVTGALCRELTDGTPALVLRAVPGGFVKLH